MLKWSLFSISLLSQGYLAYYVHTSSLTGFVLTSDPKSHLTICNGFWLQRMKSKSYCPVLFQCSNSEPQLPLVRNTLPLQVISQKGSPPLHNTLFLWAEPVLFSSLCSPYILFYSAHSRFRQSLNRMFSWINEIKLVLETYVFKAHLKYLIFKWSSNTGM